MLSALLNIFSSYIKRMRKTKEGEDLYSWVSALFLKPSRVIGKRLWVKSVLEYDGKRREGENTRVPL